MLRKREDLEAREARDIARMAREGAGSAVFTVLVVAAVVLVLAVSMNVRTQLDLSTSGANTLSPQTLEVLRGLSEPVRLYALFTKDREIERESYWNVLKKYRDASDRIEVEFVDPIEKPGRIRELGIDPQEQDLRRGGLTLVVRGERRLTFRGTDEEAITNAILEVGRTSSRVVGLLRGFGERDPASSSGGGLASAVEALRREYYRIRDVHLDQGIPADVTVLVAAGPTLPIPRDGLETLRRWLDGGGRLLALVDPGTDSGIDDVLMPWGLRVSTSSTVLDPRDNVNGSPQFLRIENYSRHPAVQGFGKRLPIALAVAAPVQNFETGEGKLFHDDLARSGPSSFAVSDSGEREPGPFAVAAASWLEHGADAATETRVVAVGDADFVSNAYLAEQANRNFFLNCIAWLGRETALVSIRRQALAGQTVDLERGRGVVVLWALAAAPLVVLVAGVVVWFRRRGR